MKSVELTGLWEKKLRQIEKGEFNAQTFLAEMKQMVSDLVLEVMRENSASITIQDENLKKSDKSEAVIKKEDKSPKKTKDVAEDTITCPKCKKGSIVKGKTAFGCSAFKEGCNFKISFEQSGKKLTDKQIFTLIEKGKTPKIKGFIKNNQTVNGSIVLLDDFSIELQIEQSKETEKNVSVNKHELVCPVCSKGTMLKGKSAWGCNRFKEGCKFIVPFVELSQQFNSSELTTELLMKYYQSKTSLF